jgi:hypothetical protein
VRELAGAGRSRWIRGRGRGRNRARFVKWDGVMVYKNGRKSYAVHRFCRFEENRLVGIKKSIISEKLCGNPENVTSSFKHKIEYS